jgi:hypothetical protein
MAQIVTQLVVDSSGAKTGVAEFEAAMKRAKDAAVAGGTATATSFDAAQRKWVESLGRTDPVIKAQIAQQQALARQQAINDNAVRLGIATQEAAAAQLAKVKAQHDATIASVREHSGQLTVAERAMVGFRNATSGVQGQLVALSAGAGPVGVFLSALGPWGLAAAIGIGAATKAMSAMSEASHELAQKSQELRMFSEATGLTTTQVQALRAEAGKFGLTSEEIQSAIQQFTARFNELRVGQGELLTQVRRVNPALADQMAGAKDAAEAMTLFGQALAQTGNIFERNALVRAGAGRGGLAAANFFANVDVNALTQSYEAAGKALDKNLIDKLAKLEIEIAKTSAKAKQNIASIFAEDDLQVELRWAKGWLEFSESVKNFSISGDLRYLLESILKIQIGGPGTLLGKMGIDYSAGYKVQQPAQITVTPQAPEVVTLPMPRDRPAQADPRYVAEQLRGQITALGDAATFAQRYSLAMQDLAIKGKEAGLTQGQLARANGALAASFALQPLQQRIGLLAELATSTDVVRAKELELQLARARGVEISAKEEARIKERARLQFEYSQLLGPNGQLAFERDQIGRSDIDATVAARLRSANLPIDFNSTEAGLIRVNEQLKLGKDLATEFAQGFARDMMNGVNATQALGNAMNRLASRLMDMAINNLVSKAFGGLFGGGGFSLPNIFGSANGNVFSGGNIVPFQKGGVLTQPTMFPMANGGVGIAREAGEDEAIIPLRRGSDGRLGVSNYGSGGSVYQDNRQFIIDARGAGPREVEVLRAEIAKLRNDVPKMAVGAVSRTRVVRPGAI